jgi:hypothetical protein
VSPWAGRLPGGSIRVRPCRPADCRALEELGHPPGVAQALSGPLLRRLEWALRGTAALGLLAEDAATFSPVGSVQFVRSRRDPATWMFNHWRVAPARRRAGIGRLLLARGAGTLRGLARLYSYVEWGNEGSIAAHLRLGFAASGTLSGEASLGALSTIGGPAPAPRLRPVPWSQTPGLFEVYRRAMGEIWLRLFPGLGPGCFLAPWGAAGRPRRRLWNAIDRLRTRVFVVECGPERAAFLVRGPDAVTLYVDPAACEAGLLARVANRLLAQGAPRELILEIRGLSPDLLARPGPIAARFLMGMEDAGRLRASPDGRAG